MNGFPDRRRSEHCENSNYVFFQHQLFCFPEAVFEEDSDVQLPRSLLDSDRRQIAHDVFN